MSAFRSRFKSIVQKYRSIFVCLFLITSALFVYGQMLNHDFVYFDDNRYVTENPRVKSGLTKDNIIWAFSTLELQFWHPLT